MSGAKVPECMILDDEELQSQNISLRGWRRDDANQIAATRLFGNDKKRSNGQEFPSAFQNYKSKSSGGASKAAASKAAAANPFPFSVNRKPAVVPRSDGSQSASLGTLISTVRETFQVDPEVESILKRNVVQGTQQERPYSPHSPKYESS